MDRAYAVYLATLHSLRETPHAIIEAAVARVTHRAISHRRRIVEGEANEVYEVGFDDGPALILRIGRDKHKHFEQERWAIERCIALEVPAPKVLWIEHLSSDSGPLDICVQEKLRGRVMTRDMLAAMACDERRSVGRQLGALLARLHSVPVDGIGYLDGAGQGAPSTNATGWDPEDVTRFLDAADRGGLGRAAMRTVLDMIDRRIPPVLAPRLVHNDMRARHVMIEADRITGIIDWGEVSGDEPIVDLAHWDYWDGDRVPIAWLREGYGEDDLFADRFEDRLALQRLCYGACVMRWYAESGFAAGVEDAKVKLERDLELLSTA